MTESFRIICAAKALPHVPPNLASSGHPYCKNKRGAALSFSTHEENKVKKQDGCQPRYLMEKGAFLTAAIKPQMSFF